MRWAIINYYTVRTFAYSASHPVTREIGVQHSGADTLFANMIITHYRPTMYLPTPRDNGM